MKQEVTKISLIVLFGLMCSTLHAQTVMKKLASNGRTSHFADALSNAHLDKKLNGEGSFTVFAPSNDAFNHIPDYRKTNQSLLLNHIMTGIASERNLLLMSEITCLGGNEVHVRRDKKQNTTIEGYKILGTIHAKNGIIHIIDGVIK